MTFIVCLGIWNITLFYHVIYARHMLLKSRSRLQMRLKSVIPDSELTGRPELERGGRNVSAKITAKSQISSLKILNFSKIRNFLA